MPKLTNAEYLIRHEMLHRVWGKDKRPFTHLSYQQQRDLHDYYNLSKTCTDEELLKHRAKVTKKNPSLPQRASRAFLAVLRPQDQPAPISVKTKSGKHITVRPLVRPEIDVEKLALALLDMVEKMTPEERARFEAEGKQILQEKKRIA